MVDIINGKETAERKYTGRKAVIRCSPTEKNQAENRVGIRLESVLSRPEKIIEK